MKDIKSAGDERASPEGFITLHGFMMKGMGLSGVPLLVFARIYVCVKSSASSRFKGALCAISVDFLLLSVQSDCREKPGLVAGANSSAFFFCSELLERYHQLTLLFLSIDIPPKSFSGKSWEFPWKVSGVYRECIRSCIKCTLE